MKLKNAVELVNPPDRLLLSIFRCLSWPPIWCHENRSCAQLQGARCDGMAHAISSFVQRRSWAADAVFRMKLLGMLRVSDTASAPDDVR